MACINKGSKGHFWPKTDVGKNRLNGPVKFVEETRYGVDEKGNKDSFGIRFIQKFDTNGNLVEYIDTDFENSTTKRSVFRYDSHGKEMEQDIYRGARDIIVLKTVINYSTDGKRVSKNKYKDDALVSKTVCVYDSRGNKIIDSMFNAHDTLLERTVSKYDDSDYLITDSTFNADNILTEATKWKYDNFHNELESDFFNAGRNTHIVFKVRYDESGNPIEQHNYFKNRLSNAYSLKYETRDNFGNWLIQKEYSSGKLEYISERVIKYWYLPETEMH